MVSPPAVANGVVLVDVAGEGMRTVCEDRRGSLPAATMRDPAGLVSAILKTATA